ncbi:MAG: type II toxin-antitoxin system prevent-host-death family antitoxin [Chloroflexi bacterium]|nr:type II toxin-antitoxin system prevent-host-death family antitoxin [Chloroflexota bacterium]
MEPIQRVARTDLARKTRQVLQAVQRGRTVVIESHGQPEAAILDIADYRILRAVMRYYSRPPKVDVEAGLTDEQVAAIRDPQERYDLVIAYYLGESISLSRAAELLQVPWFELRLRFHHLDVPMHVAPATLEELRAEVKALEAWTRQTPS